MQYVLFTWVVIFITGCSAKTQQQAQAPAAGSNCITSGTSLIDSMIAPAPKQVSLAGDTFSQSCPPGSVSGNAMATQTTSPSASVSSSDPYANQELDAAPPTIQSAQEITSTFNQKTKTQTTAMLVNPNVVFKVQRFQLYRSIWLDLRRATWSDAIDSASDLYGVTHISVGTANGIFAKPTEIIGESASVHQLLMTKDSLNLTLNEKFVTIGHTAIGSLAIPAFPTAAIAVLGGDSATVKDAIAVPTSYKQIFNKVGEADNGLYTKCGFMMGTGSAEEIPSAEDTIFCTTEFADNFSSVNTGATGQFKMDDFVRMENVSIWEPVPPSGYHCLGDVATNGKVANVELDNTGIGENADYDIGYSYYSAAVYCVKDEYLAPGVLGSLIFKNSKVAFYNIQAKDATGYNDANLFYALDSTQDPTKVTAYVLKKSALQIYEDVTPANMHSTSLLNGLKK